MDSGGDGGGGLTVTVLFCGSCGTELPPNSKFCNECGTPLKQATQSAEYKQVTVLFADVVRSMNLAAALDMERWREIVTELAQQSAAVMRRYGGIVEFTGDGVMAVFVAPAALEDHAVRACLAAVAIQEETNRLAAVVARRDGAALRVRVGLNSNRLRRGLGRTLKAGAAPSSSARATATSPVNCTATPSTTPSKSLKTCTKLRVGP